MPRIVQQRDPQRHEITLVLMWGVSSTMFKMVSYMFGCCAVLATVLQSQLFIKVQMQPLNVPDTAAASDALPSPLTTL
ncbi:hypothetical protein CEXT_70641 [Caerostris extrusa]|uniref:Uncharacterized protein n=1 Tax=Caerostris extrusa TaxID=172846 RepID=A0AAV4QRU0_CAEEX|nr:hypothetical protein CEXT_70641 [Caerostris extrusa]